MSDLLAVLPDFDLAPFSHILPSLERAAISASDILALEAFDVAKRAQVPPGEVKKLADALLIALHQDLGANASSRTQARVISTLDDGLDAALGGGVRSGYLTEIVGESAAGKTQFMLTLLLSVQLHGIENDDSNANNKSALYISTEAPLQTSRLTQILATNPKFAELPEQSRPDLSRIHSTHVHDLQAQDHILNFQVPVAIQKHNVGLVIIDSIAANYRAEFDKGSKAERGYETLAKRSNDISRTAALLRNIARKHNVAVVLANQVSDRFDSNDSALPPSSYRSSQAHMPSSTPARNGPRGSVSMLSTDDPLSLDHQQKFFSGWGDNLSLNNLKTPSLGLALTSQLATRVALTKVPVYKDKSYAAGEERELEKWDRTCKVVFSAWCAPIEVPFEIWEGGIRTLSKIVTELPVDDK